MRRSHHHPLGRFPLARARRCAPFAALAALALLAASCAADHIDESPLLEMEAFTIRVESAVRSPGARLRIVVLQLSAAEERARTVVRPYDYDVLERVMDGTGSVEGTAYTMQVADHDTNGRKDLAFNFAGAPFGGDGVLDLTVSHRRWAAVDGYGNVLPPPPFRVLAELLDSGGSVIASSGVTEQPEGLLFGGLALGRTDWPRTEPVRITCTPAALGDGRCQE